MTGDIFVFDKKTIRRQRNRCAPFLQDSGFLFDWSMQQINERLSDIKRTFPQALQIGCRTNSVETQRFGIDNLYMLDIAEKLSPNIQADEELLPFTPESFDLIVSPLNLHTTNDLPGTLAQIRTTLKEDGLFIGALLGGETLHELRQSTTAIDIEANTGITPRVFPFADIPQMGSLLQRAGFNLPVIDSEKITVTYETPLHLMKDLRLMGEGNALSQRKKTLTNKQYIARVSEYYAEHFSDNENRIKATFEVIFLLGWAPHESQQKPLKPGSAQTRLADALKANEEALPC